MNRFRTIAIFISVVMLPAGYSFAQSPGNAGKNEPKPNSHIKTKYNRSKNETTVTLKTLALSSSMNREVTRESEYGQLDLDLYFTYPGQDLTKPADAVTFTFKGTQKNQLWQRGQSLIAVIDDQTALMLGTTSYKSNSQTFYFEELMAISVPYEAMKKIASAKTLAFQLGSRNVRITADQIENIRALVARMAPQP